VRVGGGERRGSRIGKDSGDSNSRMSVSSLVNAEKHEAIASGEIYPEWEILKSRRSVRRVAEKTSFGNPGDGM
jgi:hypothetical protein